MTRQPLSELPLSLFTPSLFPQPANTSLHTPHPGAYKPRPPPSPLHHATPLHPHAGVKGVKRPRESSPEKVASHKKRHVDPPPELLGGREGEGVARRLFADAVTPARPTDKGTSTPVRKEGKKTVLAPSPEITPSSARSMPPPATRTVSAPATQASKPKSTTASGAKASLSVPSSSTHSRSPTPRDEENKENQPPRPRRAPFPAILTKPTSSKDSNPFTTPSAPRPSKQAVHPPKSAGAAFRLKDVDVAVIVGKPATPRDIGREMLLREVDEPEEVDEEML